MIFTLPGWIMAATAAVSIAALIIFLPEGDTTLVAGTYVPSLNMTPMTVYIGSCDGYSVSPSFFGKFNAQGYLTDLWFPYQGTITVDEEGVIAVDVINTYDRTVKATLNPKKEQGVENTEVTREINKRLENDMIVIEKNGVKYSVIGNVIR